MLNRCIRLASKLENKKQRIYAIIVDKKGRILSSGTNSYTRSHPRQAFFAAKVGQVHRIFLHSEMDALVRCKEQGYTLYVARVDKKGNPLPCCPCEICTLAIKDAKIQNVYHT